MQVREIHKVFEHYEKKPHLQIEKETANTPFGLSQNINYQLKTEKLNDQHIS